MTRSTGEEKKFLKALKRYAKERGMTVVFSPRENNKRFIELYNGQAGLIGRVQMGANNDLNVPGAKDRIWEGLFPGVEKKAASAEIKEAASSTTTRIPRPSKEEIRKAMASHVKGSFHQLEQVLTRLCATPVALPKVTENAPKESKPQTAQGKSWFAGTQKTPTIVRRRSPVSAGRREAALS